MLLLIRCGTAFVRQARASATLPTMVNWSRSWCAELSWAPARHGAPRLQPEDVSYLFVHWLGDLFVIAVHRLRQRSRIYFLRNGFLVPGKILLGLLGLLFKSGRRGCASGPSLGLVSPPDIRIETLSPSPFFIASTLASLVLCLFD